MTFIACPFGIQGFQVVFYALTVKQSCQFWKYFQQVNNACATGSSALYLAKQLIEGGKFTCTCKLYNFSMFVYM